nr:hypothetical protein [Tanacetum cinerariifolium]
MSPITSMIPPTAPTTHYTSLFIYTNSSGDDKPDTPPLPTHAIPPVEVAPPTSQILPAPFGVRHRRVTIVSPEQPIPYGRLYRYHPNGPVHISLYLYDSSRDSPSNSSSKMSSNSSSGSNLILHLSEPDNDPEVQAKINECIAYVDALRAGEIDDRVVVETFAREEVKTSARGTVEVRDDRVTHHVVSDDIPEPIQEEGAIKVTYETLGDMVQRLHDHTMKIPVHRVQ